MASHDIPQNDREIKLTSKLSTSDLESMNLELVMSTHTREGVFYLFHVIAGCADT